MCIPSRYIHGIYHVYTLDIEIQFSWIYLCSNAEIHAMVENILMLKPELFKKA